MKKHKKMFSFLYILYFLGSITLFRRVESTTVICGNEDDIVDIDEDHQEAILNEKEIDCLKIQLDERFLFNESLACETTWDLVSCWPTTPVNQTIHINCPNYVDKFNMKNKASKHCSFDKLTSKAEWSKTNYSLCVEPIECDDRCDLENHMKYIIIIRICGYVASMFSLSLSIFILLRPKLRCPRNYVHINLFSAFAVRTVLVMLVDSILNYKSAYDSNPSNLKANITSQNASFHKFVLCKIMMTIFRYTGSVYHVAIFGEALYLVLLLKFPYYSEKKGSTFCIILSWVLPIVWMIPWILVRSLKDNFWCWNHESSWNLIIKIPHSLLLVLNICCAIFIIRILYSKMRSRSMSREKLLKYRRLAKSILILIPVFGLHFIFFAWLPYANLVHLDLGPCFEIICTYIETFFNAFQGLVVSITSCFMHTEVRVELILLSCELLKKIKCLRSLQCLDSDYLNQLRYSQSENRFQSLNVTTSRVAGALARNNAQLLLNRSQSEHLGEKHAKQKRVRTMSARDQYNLNSIVDEEEESQLVETSSPFKKKPILTSTSNNNGIKYSSQSEIRKASVDTVLSDPIGNKCCSFLFTNQQNDFFLSESRKSKLKKSKKQILKRKKDQSNNSNNENNKHQQHPNEKYNICSECNQIKQQNSIDESILTCKCNDELLFRSNSN